MSDFIELSQGDTLWSTADLNDYTFVKETNGTYYLAHLNGTCSKVIHISKSALQADLTNRYTKTYREALTYHIEDKQSAVDLLRIHLENLDD